MCTILYASFLLLICQWSAHSFFVSEVLSRKLSVTELVVYAFLHSLMWLVSLNERSCNFSRVVFFVDFVCFLYEYWAGLFHVICVILLDSLNREKIVRYLWQKFFSGSSFSLYVKLFSRVNKDCSIVNIFMIFILFFILLFYGGVNLANFYLFFSLISKCFFCMKKCPVFCTNPLASNLG